MFPSVTREQFTSPSQLGTVSPPHSPSSPTRTGRLRGLNYLRSYTQNHLLSRESRESRESRDSQSSSSAPQALNSRSIGFPSPTEVSPRHPSQRSTLDSSAPNTPGQDSFGSTSGWLPTVGGHSVTSRTATEPQSTVAASSSAVLSPGNTDLSANMTRTRAATSGGATGSTETTASVEAVNEAVGEVPAAPVRNGMPHQLPSVRFYPHQDARAQRPSLVFSPMARILPSGKEVIKVGRYSERDNVPSQLANVPSAAPVGFKSKVVSRRHCEFWCQRGQWFIKDVKSSSGTFLNHIRLSAPGTESRPYPVNDGDIVQLGIDFKGGEEMIFRCVKIRVDLNKGWQPGPSSFNVQSHKRLRELSSQGKPTTSSSSQDCSICLGPIAPCQSLFVAPCSHTWHYKCIQVIINGPYWPHFICPNCRAVADLDAEIDDGEWEDAEQAEGEGAASAETPQVGVASTPRPPNISEDTAPISTTGEDSEPEHSPSDGALSDDELERVVNETTREVNNLSLGGTSSTSSNTPPPHDHSTVSPVDIISRKPVPNGSNGIISPQTLDPRRRTPSPNEAGSPGQMSGVEGPMTPTNDAGPFILDGKAGRDPPLMRTPFVGTSATTAGGSTADANGMGSPRSTPAAS